MVYFTEGLPITQTVLWEGDGDTLAVDLEQKAFEFETGTVLVFNEQFEQLGEITEIDNRTERRYIYDGSQGYDVEINNITLPNSFTLDGNIIKLDDGDLVILKYLAELPETIGLTVEDMVLQKKPSIVNVDGGTIDVPFAEISLLGLNTNGEEYDYATDLVQHREEMVAWNVPLDLTPFESEFFQTFHQKVINISLEDIASAFKNIDSDGLDHCYITDVLITSNDPRYEIVVDSFFIFEFDENATLYDSETYDIYAHNNLERIYVGESSDVYAENLLLDISDNKPYYHDNADIDETFYFEY